MPRFDPISTSFISGEVSPLLMGRVDIAKYANSVDTLENFLIMLQGGIMRRPGTRYVNSTKDNGIARIIPFQYSADQDYVMEMGDEYMRFYSNDAALINIPTDYDSYTKLLLHCNGDDAATTIIDEIGNTVTAMGTAQLDTAQKKFGTASLLLDGNSDYAKVADSIDWSFGTGNFTLDLWFRPTVKDTDQFLFSQYVNDQNLWYLAISAANKIQLTSTNGGVSTASYVSTAAIPAYAINTWWHLELARNGANVYMFVNGVSVGVTTNTAFTGGEFANLAADLMVGAHISGAPVYTGGYMDEVRISKGIARHTADFTAPTVEYAKLTVTEIDSPYLEEDVFEVQSAHKGDLKYMTHEDYHPRLLSRTAATEFEIDLVSFVRGPFLDTNTNAALTITPSADAGAGITLTCSEDILDYDGDLADDAQSQVGALFRVKSGVVKILTVTSATNATADVQTEPDGSAGDLDTGPGATSDWAEGAFSAYRGYPAVCAFHDGRLYYACTTYEPQKIWGSNLYDYDNFYVSATPADDEAVTFEIATEDRVAIRWLFSGNKALSIGSTGGTFSAFGSANGVITPSDIQINKDTNYGSALLSAKRISSFNYYVQRNLQKIRELSYSYDYDITRANDMNLLAEHILREGDGVVDWDYQQAPTDRLWCVRSDGEIAVMTRNPEQDVMGWSRIIAGLDSSGNGKFESVCVIPKQNSDDQVWVVVNRKVDGVTKRFIEYFTTENFDEDWDAVCLDCSLTLDSPGTITGMTNASPGVFTCEAHGFTGGEQVKINGVVLGNVSGEESEDINGTYLLVYIDVDTFSLTDLDAEAINTTTVLGYGAYISGGEIREMVTAISGLGHLEGETVQVQVDGDVPTTNEFVVASGAITLAAKAAVVHAGLPLVPYMKTLRPEAAIAAGTIQGKLKRIFKITARFYRTGACQLGSSSKQDRITFSGLETAEKDLPVPMSDEKEGQLVVTSDKPLPLTLIALMPRISTSDI